MMKIRYGCDVQFTVATPTPAVAMIDVHPEADCELAHQPDFSGSGVSDVRAGLDAFGNIVRRFIAHPGGSRFRLSGLADVDGLIDARPSADCVPVHELPDDVLTFLNPSRYCDSDALAGVAWAAFGNARRDTALVEAICDYAHGKLTFGYQFARADRTASEAHAEGVGVCRDFAHLAVALCRAMNIPARYANGYMGDIGVPADPAPMDFNAWFEAYIGGAWYTFDPRHNCRRIGRLVIAHGRDACDIPMLQTFGPHVLTSFKVVTEEVPSTPAISGPALAA